ncbi:Probable serine/threonine-protein kinase PBL3 [Linum perenne]
MGNCLRQPAKLAHASSTTFASSESDAKQESNSDSKRTTVESLNKALIASKFDASVPSNLKSFTFNDLRNATKNFKSETLLGEGGFGCVFKGWIDGNTFAPAKPGTGIVVAIKKLKTESFQGHKEWLTEVNYLGTLHHENLVKLVGYCSESDNRLLVYEFMPKGSLENHLFRKGVQPIAWVTRMQIALDVARGLSFLHGLSANVIYRDLKASNILLDSRAMDDERVGAVDETLVDWAKPFLTDSRRVLRIMDTRLGGQYSKKGAQVAAALALQCLHTDPKYRPSMVHVVSTLENLNNPKVTPSTPPPASHVSKHTSGPHRTPSRGSNFS